MGGREREESSGKSGERGEQSVREERGTSSEQEQRLESTEQSYERTENTEQSVKEQDSDIAQTSSAEREEGGVSPSKVNDGEGIAESESISLFPPTVDKEVRRRVAATKRANDETLSSAKERYMARKRAKVTAPIISEDD